MRQPISYITRKSTNGWAKAGLTIKTSWSRAWLKTRVSFLGAIQGNGGGCFSSTPAGTSDSYVVGQNRRSYTWPLQQRSQPHGAGTCFGTGQNRIRIVQKSN